MERSDPTYAGATPSAHSRAAARDTARGEVEVRLVRSRRELREFIRLPWRLYRGAANWVPPLLSKRRRHLSRKHNPFIAGLHVRSSVFAQVAAIVAELSGQNRVHCKAG